MDIQLFICFFFLLLLRLQNIIFPADVWIIVELTSFMVSIRAFLLVKFFGDVRQVTTTWILQLAGRIHNCSQDIMDMILKGFCGQ